MEAYELAKRIVIVEEREREREREREESSSINWLEKLVT
jgi:hypothetical protein